MQNCLNDVLYEDELEDLLERKLDGESPEFISLRDYIAKDQVSAMEGLLMSLSQKRNPRLNMTVI